LQSQNQAQAAGLWPSQPLPKYIEDVFSTYLLVGNATTTTINNGIDLSGKGGLVWLKDRTGGGYHSLGDTARSGNRLFSNTTDAQTTNYPFAFTSTGVTINGNLLDSARNFVTWTFRKQPKFFDVVTFTTTGSNPNTGNIAHNLGSTPGCVIVKSTSGSQDWKVYHTGLTQPGGLLAVNRYLQLNDTSAALAATNWINVSSTNISFPGGVLDSGVDYVAYLFAHDAGGFGLTGTDNVISCGSVVNTGNPQVTLGYEPQWVLFKSSTSTSQWYIVDNMRGLPVGVDQAVLLPNTSGAEVTNSNYININATGFTTNSSLLAGETLIYIAIRRGPMKVPTDATKVYNGVLVNSSASTQTVNATFPNDLTIKDYRNLVNGAIWFDRLRGYGSANSPRLLSATTGAEANSSDVYAGSQTTVSEAGIGTGYTSVDWFFRRAPSFFDEVCYTGNSSTNNLTHNLGVTPEFVIIKRRSTATYGWFTFNAVGSNYVNMDLNYDAGSSGSYAISTYASSTQVKVGTGGIGGLINPAYNSSGVTFVMYLFATCAGVSKVGSYTGTGATQTIACGFTGGARFVLIKRTDSTGDWYVWDTARGMVSGTDPSLLLNSTAAEVNANSVYTIATGFQIVSTAAGINASGGSYIFLAIA
jgi:hypothetical protein